MKQDISFVQRLTTALLTNQKITQKEADSLVATFHDRAKGRVDKFLLDEGMIEREDLLEALSIIYQVPYFDVSGYFFENELLDLFSRDTLILKGVIPLQVEKDILIVVASNPEDPELLEVLGNSVSYDIQFNVGLHQDIIESIEEYYESSIITEDENQFEDDEDDDDYEDESQNPDNDQFDDEY